MNLNTYRKTILSEIEDSSICYKLFLTILMACFTGIMAQILIPLPFTPVPITCQTIAVLASGLILGKKYGALSQIFYILIGILFIPWFTGTSGGLEVLLGSNGGYLIGFVIASYFIGYFHEKDFKNMLIISLIATFGLIYIPGLIGLYAFTYLSQGILLTLPKLLIIGFIPFIVGDIIKSLIVASFSMF